jgi:DNA-binding NtrC family response regulator
MTLEFEDNESLHDTNPTVDEGKKTILIYSPDLNFCFSLSMLFQNRYNVVTMTDASLLERFVETYGANLVIVDAAPTERMLERLRKVKTGNPSVPIIMLYVFSPRDAHLDRVARQQVDSVFYKPFDLPAMSKLINELLPT